MTAFVTGDAELPVSATPVPVTCSWSSVNYIRAELYRLPLLIVIILQYTVK
jgi:hypothetical protein